MSLQSFDITPLKSFLSITIIIIMEGHERTHTLRYTMVRAVATKDPIRLAASRRVASACDTNLQKIDR